MYIPLGTVTLRTGESVEVGLVRGPDREWSSRLTGLLGHKGDPWNWQNAQVLERDLGIDVHFYILHRDGLPFSNIMTIDLEGVGLFGHVWTNPDDRQKGASSLLMALQMDHFRARCGRALFLGTGNMVAYNIYQRQGFEGVEAQSGYMAYYRSGVEHFEKEYFGPGEVVVEPLDWKHWPASVALFLGKFPGVVRCAPAQLIGRVSTEESILDFLYRGETMEQEAVSPQALALVNRETTALVGLSMWKWHPVWPDVCLVDVYCHPAYWQHAPELLDGLQLPSAYRTIAYTDDDCPEKARVLENAGYRSCAVMPDWLPIDTARSGAVEVTAFEHISA